MNHETKSETAQHAQHEGSSTDVFPVKLTVFEGPLDLLLHLVKINELDIYDIPIAEVTRQYMEYLEWMRYLNLEVAGEFLVMAASLVHIKSRMLLPPDPLNATEGDEDDPREQLVQQLLEYKKFKDIAGELKDMENLQSQTWTRGDTKSRESVDLIEVSVFDLIQAMTGIFQRLQTAQVKDIIPDHIRIEDEMKNIMEQLESREPLVFQEFFRKAETRIQAIVIFLSILELVRAKKILVYQAQMFGDIYLRRRNTTPV